MVKVTLDGKDVQNSAYNVGVFTLLDNAADPSAEGEIARNGNDTKVFAGGKLVSLSGVTAQDGSGTSAPGVSDDTTAGYAPGSLYTDTTNNKAYICLDATEGAAVWTEITVTSSAGSAGGELAGTYPNPTVAATPRGQLTTPSTPMLKLYQPSKVRLP